MKAYLPLFAGLFFWSNTVNALPSDLNEKTCQALKSEMMQFFADNEGGNFQDLAPGNPISKVLDAAMDGLGKLEKDRIHGPLVQGFVPTCMEPTEYGLPEDVTVGDALRRAITELELDTTAPNWGLLELPELDFEKDSCMAFINMMDDLPEDELLDPTNNLFKVMTDRFYSRYDLSTPEAQQKAQTARSLLAFESQAMENEPCGALFTRLFAEVGLEPK